MIDSLINLRSINLINFLFAQLIVIIVLLGGLIATIEKYLPTSIKQTFRYGKHAHKGPQDRFVSLLEVPKAWFKHFYVFAAIWSALGFYFMVSNYLAGQPVPSYVIDFLDVMATTKRTARTSPTETMVALILITMQCWRRLYETWCVQVFSSKLKINLSAYLVGYIHYFGTVVMILSQAEGFIRSEALPLTYRFEMTAPLAGWIAIFIYAWRYQFQSNLILANLRKDRTGKVTNQKHSIPRGGYFVLVSSPHMFFEIVMYGALYAIMAKNTSALYVFAWVLSNQTMNAWLTHQWYRENFADYPAERRAVFPGVL